jgi:hypothetical protein
MLQTALAGLSEFYHRPILLLTPGPNGELAAEAGDPLGLWLDRKRAVGGALGF